MSVDARDLLQELLLDAVECVPDLVAEPRGAQRRRLVPQPVEGKGRVRVHANAKVVVHDQLLLDVEALVRLRLGLGRLFVPRRGGKNLAASLLLWRGDGPLLATQELRCRGRAQWRLRISWRTRHWRGRGRGSRGEGRRLLSVGVEDSEAPAVEKDRLRVLDLVQDGAELLLCIATAPAQHPRQVVAGAQRQHCNLWTVIGEFVQRREHPAHCAVSSTGENAQAGMR
mmetsp:Transcript_9537/g.38960  ORF Transcript_9537/g.38960 Transcript_9537/m.38960 type:complete len:227 (+) Transcript_9537:1298-1978(+)